MTLFYLQQAEPIIEGVGTALEGKSEPFTLVFLGIVLIGFVIWRWECRANKEDARQDEREKHQREKDIKDSESLAIVSDSTRKTAEATQIMANAVKNIEKRQQGDRRAIIHVIAAIQSQPNNPEQARDSLDRARQDLLEG